MNSLSGTTGEGRSEFRRTRAPGFGYHCLESCGPYNNDRHKIAKDRPDFFDMLRSLPSAIDDAHDTLYEPNAVFRQLLESARFFFIFFFSPRSIFCLFLLFLSFSLFFSFIFCFGLLSSLLFPLSPSFIVFVFIFQLTYACRACA